MIFSPMMDCIGGLYAYDGRENIGDIRIWRSKNKDNFDQNSVQLLEMIMFKLAQQRHTFADLCEALLVGYDEAEVPIKALSICSRG